MTTKVVTLKELGQELRDFGKATLEQQKKAVILGLARSLPMLARKSPVDTGSYAASWDMTADETRAIIGNYAPHAPVIEFGARPFKPPLGPLLAWAKRVLQDPSQPPNYSPHVWALAKYTQKKIAVKGMAPKLVLSNALPDIIRNIKAELERIEA